MSDKKGFGLGALLDVFTNEVPEKAAPTRNTPIPSAPSATVGSAPIGADPKLVASLEARLNAALPAPYQAFLEMFQSLAEDIPDEGKRMKVALKTSKTSVDDLLHSIDQLVASMNKAKEDFGHSLERQQQAYAQLTQDISTKEAQLAQLQKEVSDMHAEAASDHTKIDQMQRGFESAYSQVLGKLESQKTRIASMK